MYEQKNRPFSFEPVGLKLFIIRLCQLWEDEQADYCRMFESIRGLGEDKANNTRVFRKVTNSFLSDWYAKLKEFISDAKTGLIEIQNNKDNKKPAQLLDEILSFDTKEVETYLEKYKDQNTLDTSVMSPFSAFIITQWDKIANLHEYFARQSGCVFISDLDKLSNMKLNVEDRKSLTLLMGFFENASNRFPAVKHTVISWPFVCEMPCPPNENVQDFCKGEKKTYDDYLYIRPMMETNSLTKSLPVKLVANDEIQAANTRFEHLSVDAGELLSKYLPNIVLSEGDIVNAQIYENIWITALHITRNTLEATEDWGTLLEGDYWKYGLERELYKFWESKDVFLDSAILCKKLLTNEKKKELTQEFSKKYPNEADRFKKFFERLESVKTKLTAKKATDEEIDLAVFDLLVKQIRIDPNLKKDLPPTATYVDQGILRGALFIYAQVHYKIIEVVSSSPVAYADLSLNQYYLQVVKKIKYLLSLDELKGFTGEFNPPEHILPSSGLADIGWEDGAAPYTEGFLVSAQTFLNELDFSGDVPEEITLIQKWLHKQIEPITETIEEYRQTTKKYFNGLIRNIEHQKEKPEKTVKSEEQSKPYTKKEYDQFILIYGCLKDLIKLRRNSDKDVDKIVYKQIELDEDVTEFWPTVENIGRGVGINVSDKLDVMKEIIFDKEIQTSLSGVGDLFSAGCYIGGKHVDEIELAEMMRKEEENAAKARNDLIQDLDRIMVRLAKCFGVDKEIRSQQLSPQTPAETEPNIKPKAETWSQVSIDVLDDQTVRYKIDTEPWKRLHLAELGFMDDRKGQPNQLWPLFREMAKYSSGGYIDIRTAKNISKDKQRICKTLREFFGPSEIPIQYERKTKRYVLKFSLSYKSNA